MRTTKTRFRAGTYIVSFLDLEGALGNLYTPLESFAEEIATAWKTPMQHCFGCSCSSSSVPGTTRGTTLDIVIRAAQATAYNQKVKSEADYAFSVFMLELAKLAREVRS